MSACRSYRYIFLAFILLQPLTVVGESLSERLIALGYPSAVPSGRTGEQAAVFSPDARFYYKDGVWLDTDEYRFRLRTFLQPRYQWTDPRGGDGEETSSFYLRRVRVSAQGEVPHFDARCELQIELHDRGDAEEPASTSLLDAFVELPLADQVTLRLGQFSTRLARQFVNSARMLQLPDRSVATNFFSLERQAGAHLAVKVGRTELSAGIFNGESPGEGRNRGGEDTHHTGIVTVRRHLIGEMNPFIEGDIPWSESLAVNVGSGYAASGIEGALDDYTDHSVSADLNLKYRGLSLHGEWFSRWYGSETADTAHGYYVQAGYFIVPNRLEIAARFAEVRCDAMAESEECSGGRDLRELTTGINYYLNGHALKAQLAHEWRNYDDVIADDEATGRHALIFQIAASF